MSLMVLLVVMVGAVATSAELQELHTCIRITLAKHHR